MGNDHPHKKKYGSIVVRTHQPFYYAGDTVSGVVYLHLVEDFPGRKIVVKVKGKEKCKFVTSHIEHEGEEMKTVYTDRAGKRVNYRHKIPLYKAEEKEIPKGQYQFPFSMKLKDKISSSYENSGKDWSAKVMYKLIVELGNKKNEDDSLDDDIPLIIRPKPTPNEDEEGDKFKKEINLSKFCCVPAGKLKVKAKFDQDSYVPGDKAEVKIKLDNTEGTVPLDKITLSLVNEVTLKSDDGFHKMHRAVLRSEEAGGIGPLENKEDDPVKIKLELKSGSTNLQPTTLGDYVKNEYTLKLQFLSSGCACIFDGNINNDILMHAELPKESNFYKYTEPPKDWNPKNMEEVNLVATDEFAEPPKKERVGKKYKQPKEPKEPKEEMAQPEE